MASEPAAVRNGLGPLVLVVRERQVAPAPVQVEVLAQEVEGHDHALGVPTGAAGAPGRVPGGLTGLRRLPQGEVQRRALLLPRLHPGARPERVE